MKRKSFFAVILAAVLMAGCQKESIIPAQQEQSVQDNQIVEGYYVVTLQNDAPSDAKQTGTYETRVKAAQEFAVGMFKEYGFNPENITEVYGCALKGFTAKLSNDELDLLRKDKRIVRIESDRYFTLNDRVEGFDLGIKAQTIPWGITRVGGSVIYTGTRKAWIIDTGIDLDHPDLNVNTALSKNFVNTSKTADDDNGHGSHVAGTIAARDNTIGVVGVAAGATLVAVKVLNRSGSGTYSVIIAGVDYVAANGAAGDVANMSLGGSVYATLDAAILSASSGGIWFTLAAGNEADDANNYSPARVNGTYIYTLSAMDITDHWASFSNYGNPPIDYCAPGVSIYSCYKNGGYATMSGTSMSAPHAAGVRLLGTVTTDGYVIGDPDGNPDPIIHR